MTPSLADAVTSLPVCHWLIWGGTDKWNEGDQQTLDLAGHWGVPSMVFEAEPFFGQDPMDTLRWQLSQRGLGR